MSAEPATSSALASTTYEDQGPRVVLLHVLFGQGCNFTGVAKSLADEAQI